MHCTQVDAGAFNQVIVQKALDFFCTIKICCEGSRFLVLGVVSVGGQRPVRLLHLLEVHIHPKIDCNHNTQVRTAK